MKNNTWYIKEINEWKQYLKCTPHLNEEHVEWKQNLFQNYTLNKNVYFQKIVSIPPWGNGLFLKNVLK